MTTPRIAHVTLILSHSPGVARKLNAQGEHARRHGIPIDFYWFCGPEGPDPAAFPGVRIRRLSGRNPFGLRRQQCQAIHSLLDTYDRVLLRYPLVDPILFLGLRRKNRILLEHHAKEVEELRSTGDKRWPVEQLIGGRWIQGFRGLTAVTQEILDYEIARSGFRGSTAFFPNTIDTRSFDTRTIAVRADRTRPIRLGMVSSLFAPWQGLDQVLESMSRSQVACELHLAGKVPPELVESVSHRPDVHLHGVLSGAYVQKFYDQVDIGIGAFNLHSKGLRQATTLKVRDYLAAGLPVVLGYEDPAFPESFPYVQRQDRFDLQRTIDFAEKHSSTARSLIQEVARPYIDSEVVTRRLYEFCCTSREA